jgi:hypothetical protein
VSGCGEVIGFSGYVLVRCDRTGLCPKCTTVKESLTVRTIFSTGQQYTVAETPHLGIPWAYGYVTYGEAR